MVPGKTLGKLTAALLLTIGCLHALPGAEIEFFELTSLAGTERVGVQAQTAQFRGKAGIHVTVSPDHEGCKHFRDGNCTFLNIPTQPFHNGIIEVEVAGMPVPGSPDWSRGFVGIVFRVNEDYSRYEGMYVRPTNSTAPDQVRRNHTTQYFSYPDFPWYRLREEAPGKYESWADVKTADWMVLRIEVDGSRARLYLDNHANPVLVVNDLKLGAAAKGTIGLFTEVATNAYFRNLKVTYR